MRYQFDLLGDVWGRKVIVFPDHIANRYNLLYYQFIKHTFGLIHHCDNPKEDTYLKLYFDKLPISTEENDAFKAHIGFMQNHRAFKKARIKIRPDFDIALTTKASGPKDFWIIPYRHWLFLPAEFKDKK